MEQYQISSAPLLPRLAFQHEQLIPFLRDEDRALVDAVSTAKSRSLFLALTRGSHEPIKKCRPELDSDAAHIAIEQLCRPSLFSEDIVQLAATFVPSARNLPYSTRRAFRYGANGDLELADNRFYSEAQTVCIWGIDSGSMDYSQKYGDQLLNKFPEIDARSLLHYDYGLTFESRCQLIERGIRESYAQEESAHEFVNLVIIPRINRGLPFNLNIVTHSGGGAFVRLVENALFSRIAAAGFDQEDTQRIFNSVSVVKFGFALISDAEGDVQPRFPTVSILSSHDIIVPMSEYTRYLVAKHHGAAGEWVAIADPERSGHVQVVLTTQACRESLRDGQLNYMGHLFDPYLQSTATNGDLTKFLDHFIDREPGRKPRFSEERRVIPDLGGTCDGVSHAESVIECLTLEREVFRKSKNREHPAFENWIKRNEA